eukprot:6486725-Amphidinium_carterae.1
MWDSGDHWSPNNSAGLSAHPILCSDGCWQPPAAQNKSSISLLHQVFNKHPVTWRCMNEMDQIDAMDEEEPHPHRVLIIALCSTQGAWCKFGVRSIS